MNTKIIWGIVIVLVLAVGAWAVFKKGGDDAMMKDDVMKQEGAMQKDDAMMKDDSAMKSTGGTYEIYNDAKLAKADTGKVILFLHDPSCSTCQALDADIKKHIKDMPSDMTILNVGDDAYPDLKKKYNVAEQNVLLQVDSAGAEISKWTDLGSLSDLLSKVK